MVAQPRRQHLTVPVAALGGAVLGLVAALAVALVPGDVMSDAMLASGLPAILPAAAPPLGATARVGLALVTAGAIGLGSWFLFFVVVGTRTIVIGRTAEATEPGAVPVLRRADAHPDAPARRPLFAMEDLGTPFLDVHARSAKAEPEPDRGSFAMPRDEAIDVLVPVPSPDDPRPIPDDLDIPLSAYDPAAIPVLLTPPPVAEPEPEPVFVPKPAPMARAPKLEPGERIETFELTPMVRREAAGDPLPIRRDPVPAPAETEATVASLLERLERSVTARQVAPRPVPVSPPVAMPRPPRSINDTLGELRELASRAG